MATSRPNFISIFAFENAPLALNAIVIVPILLWGSIVQRIHLFILRYYAVNV